MQGPGKEGELAVPQEPPKTIPSAPWSGRASLLTSPRLFLLGGIAALGAAAARVTERMGAEKVRLAILLQDETGWAEHRVEYTSPWTERGVSAFLPVVPDASGRLDPDTARASLLEASCIVIGGGDARAYQRLYAGEPLRGLIRERHRDGVPVLGISAGALISLADCVLFPRGGGRSLEVVPGLGLAREIVVGVHFTERGQLPALLEAMASTRTSVGWGLDEPGGIVLEGDRVAEILGAPAHRIVMTDFEARRHTTTVVNA